MCPHTSTYVSSIATATRSSRLLYGCPHTAIYVSSYCLMCVLILLYTCPHTVAYVSSYCYVCVLILLYMCPHTHTSVHDIATCRWREVQQSSPGPGCRLDARMLRVGRSIVLYGGSNGHAALGICRLYICVLMLGLPALGIYVCPHTAIYVSSYCLTYVSSTCYMCVLILVHILLYMCACTTR